VNKSNVFILPAGSLTPHDPFLFCLRMVTVLGRGKKRRIELHFGPDGCA